MHKNFYDEEEVDGIAKDAVAVNVVAGDAVAEVTEDDVTY